MKLLAIRGRNLASLEGDFEVDFAAAPLAGAGLFAVTGPNGAGKSTLLDTVCVALYGAAPRLDWAAARKSADDDLTARDARNLLRHGATEAAAEVDFLGRDLAVPGRRRAYRARWETKRAYGRLDGKLQPAQITLTDLGDGQPIGRTKPEVRSAIEARVGLSFEQFRRSVMLAQGDFEAFLRADRSERAQLLERIIGGADFGAISIAAHRRAAAEATALQELEAEAGAHRPLSPEERAAAEEDARFGAERLAAARARRAALAEEERWTRRSRLLAEEEDAAEAARRAAADRFAAEAGAAKERLEHDRRKTSEALAGLKGAEAAEPWAARLADRREETEAALAAVSASSRALRQQADAERKRESARAALEERLAVLRDEDAADKNADAEARDEEEAERAVLEGLDPEGAERRAAALREAHRLAGEAVRDGERYAEARERAEAAAAKGMAQKTAAQAETARLSEIAAALPDTEQRRAHAQRRLDRWRAALSETAEGLRAQLEPGRPCPVCGGTDHAADALTHAAREAAAEEQEALAAVEGERDALLAARAAAIEAERAALKAHKEASAEMRSARVAADAARQSGVEILARLRPPLETIAEPALLPPADALAACLSAGEESDALTGRAEAMEKALNAAEDALDATLAELRTQRRRVEAAERRRREIERRRSARAEKAEGARAERDALEEERRASEAAVAEAKETGAAAAGRLDAAVADFLPDWRRLDLKETGNRIAEAADAATARRTRIRQLEARLPRIEADQEALAAMIGERSQDPDAAADASESARRGELSAISAAADALANAEARREAALRAAEAHAAERPETPADLINAPPPETADAALEALAEAQDAAAADETKAEGAAEAAKLALKQDDLARERRQAAEAALQQRAEEGAVWRRLGDLIGSADGAKFRRFAQALTLEALVAAANRRLGDLAPRYALRQAPGDPADPDLALEAVDQDMAEAARPAAMLSGGERFLVSLALALALSDLSSDQGVRVDSLFIDEGFGALDGDSLTMALSALEALQATGRQVGVVTHVEALIERIATKIEVAPIGGGRSRIALTGP